MENLGICRICLNKDVQHVVKNPQLQEIYEQLTAIPFQTDMRPLALCYICFAQLKTSHRFKVKCLKAEELLAQMLDQMLTNEDGVLDPTLVDRSALEQMSFTIIEQTVITDQALQDVDKEKVYGTDVKMEDQNTQERPETANSTDSGADNEQSLSDPGDDVPLNNIKKEIEITIVEEDVMGRKRRQNASKKAAPIAKETKLKPAVNETTQDIKKVNTDPVTVKAEASKSVPNDDIIKPILNNKIISENNVDTNMIHTKNIVNKSHHNDAKSSLVNHHNLKKKIPIEKQYICDMCYKMFNNKFGIIRHWRIHTERKPHNCDGCKESFSKKSLFIQHACTHTKNRPIAKQYICDMCYKVFYNKFGIIRHLRIHNDRKLHNCDVCNKSFTKKSSFIQHARTHTGEKPYACDLCGKSYTNKSSLTVHARTHTGEKPYVCDVCGKSYTENTTLRKHTRIHTGDKRHVCNVCGKRFIDNRGLYIHSRVHTGEKPHVCNVCGKGYSVKSTLVKHTLLHTGEKPHACNVCNKRFSTKGQVKSHLRMHTGEKYACD